jgi:anti-anti-sigma regulatory factor
MQVQSFAFDLESKVWSAPLSSQADSPRTLVLAFGATEIAERPECIAQLAKAYPRSIVIGCSSAGEIHGTTVRDGSLAVSVTKFERTDLMLASLDVATAADSFATGQALAKKLSAKAGLRGVMVLSEGLAVNGSELVRGLNSVLDETVVVAGGLSGDGTRFKKTWVSVGASVKSNVVAAVGFYGDFVQIGHGSKGGWDKFGPERVVTRSEANVLYELDGKPALALYKEYLGDKAKELPASGLLFPLSMRATNKDDKFLVRTLLAVDHEKNSLTFAGDIPKGHLVQLMKADFDRLIGGASIATAMAKDNGTPVGKDALVVAISCVGRRLVLGSRTEEEVEAVLEALPKAQQAHITGFYSYGEISPYASGHCDLHNQTMTLTVFSESAIPLPKRAPAATKPAMPAAKVMPAAATTGLHVDSFAYDLSTQAWSVPAFPDADSARTLVLAFGAPEVLAQPECFAQLAKAYPRSILVGCSSAGEIHGTTIRDMSLAVTISRFDKTDLALTSLEVDGPADSFMAGQTLAKKLAAKQGLRGVMILSEGLNVNGSELVRGINSVLDESVVVSGGLSGDGSRFKQTWVAVGSKVKSNVVAAVGFYGDYVQIGHGSKGGWDKFGPERIVTRSEGNVLFELDGKPALALYKEYLGDKAKELPASGLLFPLSLRSSSKDDKFLVRTLLAVDDDKNSLTFAGDIPKGFHAQLMKADFDRLIDGASIATGMAKDNGTPIGNSTLVVAISCVGRRLVLGARTEEEVEAVLEALPKGQKAHITGFYSYGEISPYASGHCDLHNQTMTLTVFSESATPLPRRTNKTEGAGAGAGAGAAAVPTVRPPPAPLPAGAAPPALRADHASPLDEIDFELTTSTTNTRPIATIPDGFGVSSFGYDLESKKWSVGGFPELDTPRTLVLAFGASEILGDAECFGQLARAYPKSIVVGCSSAGEIHGTSVRDRSLSVTVARFEKTDMTLASLEVDGPGDSFTTGQALAKKLSAKANLRGVMILSEGLNVNGSELVRGINSVLDDSVVVTGGLSGDGSRFKQTWVAIGSKVKSNVVAAVGFYGDYVQIGHGSQGGWDKFGPERVVTKSDGNVLYELDGKPALALYKEYLGEKAKELPASGLLFPLSLRSSNKDDKVLVRTLLAVDHEKNSLTFAGDIPKGYLAQLMKANFDRLIGGASIAAAMAKDNGTPIGKDALVVAISCVGRRLVLGERTEEEVEAVLAALPKAQQAHITGFYSYGEISPYASGHCDLHNQTMTLTVFSESPTPLPRRTTKTSGTYAPAKAPPVPAPSAAAKATMPAVAAKPPPSLLVPSDAPQSMATPIASPLPPPTSSPISKRIPGTAVTRVSMQASGATGANVNKQMRGNITMLTITGRLTESFKGDALGRELRGTVAIDLAGVERITSFGVREWLAMLGSMQEVRRLFLLRCSEAVVNQLSMIRKFSGSGQIVSFFAPYLCGACGEQFERSFDCETEAEAIRSGNAPEAPCAHCGAPGSFDDDARTYFAFAAPHLNTAVPAEVRSIQDELDAAAPAASRDAVDKTVEGNVTRVRVNTKLGTGVRWKRVLDGIEGLLVVDLGGVTGVEPAGITNFEQALASVGSEVTSIAIERCPIALVERFAQVGVPRRVTVTSGTLDAYCASCAVHRPALVSLSEHGDALSSGQPPRVNCKRCNGELALRNADAALRFLQSQQKTGPANKPESKDPPSVGMTAISHGNVPVSLAGMAVAPRPALAAASDASQQAGAPKKRPRATTFAIGALSLAVVGLIGMQVLRSSGGTQPAATAAGPAAAATTANAPGERAETPEKSAAASPGNTANVWMQNVDLPPAWVERPFVLENNDVYIVGKSELSATPEAALLNARNEAIVRVVKQLHQELAGTAVHDFVQARVRDDRTATDAIAARFLKQFGTTATPERVDAALRKRDAGVEGFARYKLSKASYQQLVASYRETTNIQGMVVARFFPLLETSLHSDGDLVVLSVQRGRPADAQNVRAGDIILDVGGRPTSTLETLTRATTDEWASTPARGQMSIDIESAGAKRTVKIFKPAPTPAQGN